MVCVSLHLLPGENNKNGGHFCTISLKIYVDNIILVIGTSDFMGIN